jgi:hypothetical protein
LTSPNDSRFLTTAPFRARLLLFAAAFFAFSTLGFVVDALRPAVSAVVATRRGDIYALVTDGLTEVFDANDAGLGLDPLKEMIRAHASRPLTFATSTASTTGPAALLPFV